MASDMQKMIPAVASTSNTAGSDIVSSLVDMAYDRQEDAARLKAIFEKKVKARGETREEFGRRSGLGKPANVSHYLNGKNNLDVDSARKFAANIPCKIEEFSPYWARVAQASGQVAVGEKPTPLALGVAQLAPENNPHNTQYMQERSSDTPLRMPLLSWGRVVDLMLEENDSLAGTEGVAFIDADGEYVGGKTKCLDMPDDSMQPKIMQGDRLVVEPEWVPEPGEIVVVKDRQGSVSIRRYKLVRPGHFIAEPVNVDSYHPLDSKADNLVVLAVVVARREFLAKRRR